MKNLVIGITGGIGSGKSTVSNIIMKQNYPVLIADNIAREIMENDSSVIDRIIKNFGVECYDENLLNPKILAEKVFGNQEKLNLLNAIVHPPTILKIDSEIKKLSRSAKLIFVEAALIFEANMEFLFDYILLVTAEENIRIKRIAERGRESEYDIKDRMSHQLPESKKLNMADFVIHNNSSLEILNEKTNFFLNLFKQLI